MKSCPRSAFLRNSMELCRVYADAMWQVVEGSMLARAVSASLAFMAKQRLPFAYAQCQPLFTWPLARLGILICFVVFTTIQLGLEKNKHCWPRVPQSTQNVHMWPLAWVNVVVCQEQVWLWKIKRRKLAVNARFVASPWPRRFSAVSTWISFQQPKVKMLPLVLLQSIRRHSLHLAWT